jgi:hypothetical protein
MPSELDTSVGYREFVPSKLDTSVGCREIVPRKLDTSVGCREIMPSKLDPTTRLLTFIWKVSGSTLSIDTNYRDAFFAAFWVPPVKCRDITLNQALTTSFHICINFIVHYR